MRGSKRRPNSPARRGGDRRVSDPVLGGPDRLSDAEVVALVLNSGGPRSARDVAEQVVSRGGLSLLRDARVVDLVREAGIERESAERLVASVELGRRVYGIGEEGPVFESPDAVYLFNRDLAQECREHFAVLLLNARNRILKREVVSIGSLNASIVHPREVFRPAILESAASVVLVHNHPSGDTMPSRDDIEITRRLIRGGEMLGIQVLDHVIVAGRSYLSMRRERMI